MPGIDSKLEAHQEGAAAERLDRLETLVHFLETAVRVPGTRIRFGADAILGLVPGLGDLVGGLLAALVIGEGIRSGVPRPVLFRMFWNVAVDVILGAVPGVGDVFDVFWKAGVRNLALLRRYHDLPDRTVAASRRGMLALAAGVGLLAAAGMALAVASTVLLVRWLLSG